MQFRIEMMEPARNDLYVERIHAIAQGDLRKDSDSIPYLPNDFGGILY